MTVVFLTIFIVLSIIELLTTSLVSIWFAIGALITTFVSLQVDNIMILLAVFTLSSILLLLFIKSFVKKIKNKEVVPTNLDQVIGKIGIVTSSILKDEVGEVKVLGKTWSAIADKKITKDKKVIIKEINGVKLKVEEIKESDK